MYLYLKTHNTTGLKYLGKTSSKTPDKYHGSGKYWKRHIQKHGYNVTTEILFQSDNPEEIKQQGIFYSVLWNVVESKEFANLKDEAGDGGWGFVNSDKKVLEGRRKRMLENNPFKGKKHTDKSRLAIKEARKKQVMGPRSEETKQKIRKSLLGHEVSDETRLKQSIARVGKPPSEKVILIMRSKIQCPYCSKKSNPAIMKRWHFNNCKYKEIICT